MDAPRRDVIRILETCGEAGLTAELELGSRCLPQGPLRELVGFLSLC